MRSLIFLIFLASTISVSSRFTAASHATEVRSPALNRTKAFETEKVREKIRKVRWLDEIATAPSNCDSWKAISQKLYQVPSAGISQNDFIGDILTDAHRRGWTEDAAKQLFTVALAAYSDQSLTEQQFIAAQFEKCKVIEARPGPKYPNINIALYWSSKKTTEAEADFQRNQNREIERNQLVGPCLQYQAKASLVPVYIQKRISMQDAISLIAASAYGPGGIAYRDSPTVDALLSRMVRAGYQSNRSDWRNERNQPTTDFSEYAFARCINGAPF